MSALALEREQRARSVRTGRQVCSSHQHPCSWPRVLGMTSTSMQDDRKPTICAGGPAIAHGHGHSQSLRHSALLAPANARGKYWSKRGKQTGPDLAGGGSGRASFGKAPKSWAFSSLFSLGLSAPDRNRNLVTLLVLLPAREGPGLFPVWLRGFEGRFLYNLWMLPSIHPCAAPFLPSCSPVTCVRDTGERLTTLVS